MKKMLLTVAGCGLGFGVFAQGVVNFENALGTGNVTINGSLAQPGTYQVALLWFNGTSFQQVGAVYQTSTENGDGPGYFIGEDVTIPTYAPTGTFIVQGWQGNFASYAGAAASGFSLMGQTPSFASPESDPNAVPPLPAANLSGANVGLGPGGWDGNLVLQPIPEPSTIALGGLGALAFGLFRRRK